MEDIWFEDVDQDTLDAEFEDDGQPSTYEEYQDLWDGDDAFETCSYCEDF